MSNKIVIRIFADTGRFRHETLKSNTMWLLLKELADKFNIYDRHDIQLLNDKLVNIFNDTTVN